MTVPEILDELKGVFEEKNDDYGNSYEKVGILKRVMADEEGPRLVELYPDGTYDIADCDKPTAARHEYSEETQEPIEAVVLADTPKNTTTFEENADGLITRLLDKLNRTYTLIFLKDEPALDNESTEDAAKDMAGYSAMLTSLIRRA